MEIASFFGDTVKVSNISSQFVCHNVQSFSTAATSCNATEILLSYHNGGDKLVEVDELDAAHCQRHAHVHPRHVQVGVALCGICVIHHAEVKHLLICY